MVWDSIDCNNFYLSILAPFKPLLLEKTRYMCIVHNLLGHTAASWHIQEIITLCTGIVPLKKLLGSLMWFVCVYVCQRVPTIPRCPGFSTNLYLDKNGVRELMCMYGNASMCFSIMVV